MTKLVETKHELSRRKKTHAGAASRRRLLRVSAAAALAAGLVQARHVLAAEETWTNGSSDSTWNTTSLLDWNLGPWVNGNDAVFGTTGVGNLTVAGGISATYITFNTAGYTLNSGNLTLTGGVGVSGGIADLVMNANATIGTQITGASNVFTTGNSTLTLTGSNNYTGNTQVTNGSTLSISSLANIGGANIGGNSSFYVAVQTGGTLQYTGSGSETRTGTLYLNSGSTNFNITQSTGQLTFNITAAHTVGANNGTTSIALTKTGNGTLTLIDTNPTGLQLIIPTVSAGTLELVEMYGGIVNYPAPTLSGGTLALSAGTTSTYIAEISTVTGAAGTTFAVEGPGAVGNDSNTANWTSNLASLSVASGATFDLRNNNVTVDALTGSGFIGNSFATNTLIVGKNGGSGTFNGVIAGNASGTQVGTATHYNINSGTLALTKVGSGVETFTGSSVYSGGTTVSAGTLRANNAIGSATGTGSISVAATTSGNYTGGRLGGNGTVSGAVTLAAGTSAKLGGIITAGADDSTVGTFKTGAETWSNGSVYQWKIGSDAGTGNVTLAGINGTPGTTYDQLLIGTGTSGQLTVPSTGGTAATIELAGALAGITLGANGTQYNWAIAQVGTGNSTIAGGNGTITASTGTPLSSSIFALDTSTLFTVDGAAPNSGSFSLYFETIGSNNDLVLHYDATPEPGTPMLLFTGVVPLLLRRRRQQRS